MAQFVSFGNTLAALSNQLITPWMGAIFLALLLYIYEAIGGLKAVV